MSTRENQRIQFAFTSALALHALAVVAMIEYSRAINSSETMVASVMNVNWEVESSVQSTAPKRAPVKSEPQNHSQSQPISESSVHGNAPNLAAPNPALMANYLASLRDRLGNAIHLHQPRGKASSQLILKVEISSTGVVGKSEIEKSSENAEADRAVLAAFASLLPLSPFPEGWRKSAQSSNDVADTITVRIPVVIRPKN